MSINAVSVCSDRAENFKEEALFVQLWQCLSQRPHALDMEFVPVPLRCCVVVHLGIDRTDLSCNSHEPCGNLRSQLE